MAVRVNCSAAFTGSGVRSPELLKTMIFTPLSKPDSFCRLMSTTACLKNLLQNLAGLEGGQDNRPKLLLSGMVFDPLEIYKIFDELDVCIVDDDFANGWRTVAKGELNTDNLVEGITDFLFKPAPCCCIYNPDNDRHPYLLDKVKESGADGVLFWYIKFCEPDAFDRPQLMKHLKDAGMPVAFIDLELTMTNFDAVRTRIGAFCEMLES